MEPTTRQTRSEQALPATTSRAPIAALPAVVVERIAAGEVIERPVSVVRELLDNSLDAGAADIRVELREGGRRLIRVSDDGCGIPADELPLACQRHTTSKIAGLDDLARLTTLGFRGEALASVATVADLEIVTSTGEGGPACGLTVTPHESGSKQWLASRERGTSVTVRHLFRAVPARQALLAAPNVEKARCLQVIRSYACAHPATQFTVVADGEVVLQTPGTSLQDTIIALFGVDAATGMLSFTASPLPSATIVGQVSSRSHTRTTRDYVMLVVNGRLVANRGLLAAAESGYRPLLRKGRHPVLLAALTVPPDWIDATTHPTKAEALLRHEREIARSLQHAIHEALGAAPATIDPATPQAPRFHPQPGLRFPPHGRGRSRASAMATSLLRERSGAYGQSLSGPLTAIAQLNDMLILARGTDGALYLVDQHRAHERVLYDLLRERTVPTDRAGSTASFDDPMSVVNGYMKDPSGGDALGGQMLLDPQLIELSTLQARQLTARLHELAGLGLSLQPFGGQMFLARSVPTLPGAAHLLGEFVRELTIEASVDTDDWLDHLRASLACRAAIRRGQSLSPHEQQALLDDLAGASAPAVCPHGSPIALALSPDHLADVFEW